MFVFFQAEDGIRDIGVTGVQTCALPISAVVVATTAGCSTRAPESSGGGGEGEGGAASGEVLTDIGIEGETIRLGVLTDLDRKSVVEGKRVDLGGRRII